MLNECIECAAIGVLQVCLLGMRGCYVEGQCMLGK